MDKQKLKDDMPVHLFYKLQDNNPVSMGQALPIMWRWRLWINFLRWIILRCSGNLQMKDILSHCALKAIQVVLRDQRHPALWISGIMRQLDISGPLAWHVIIYISQNLHSSERTGHGEIIICKLKTVGLMTGWIFKILVELVRKYRRTRLE